MPDHYLQLVAEDPEFVPDARAVADAIAILQAAVPEAVVSARASDAIVFFDPGSNWSGVACHLCGKDASAWWSDAVGPALERSDLSIITPCCRRSVSLNDLHYEWPARFARFALVAMNANVKALPKDLDMALEDLVGVRLTIVRRRI